jgi:hypothetical protein
MRSAILLLAVVASAAVAPALGTGPAEDFPNCGETSPVDNSCSPDLFSYDRDWTLFFDNVLGFVGHLHATVQSLEDRGALSVDCDVIADAQPALSTCTNVVPFNGGPHDGARSQLVCTASRLRQVNLTSPPTQVPAPPDPVAGMPPPVGSWHCMFGVPQP